MAKTGVVALSNLGNVAASGTTKTIEIIGNDDNYEWITFENRLSYPVGVQPAYYGSAGSMPIGFTVPALHRSTLPIDPDQDVFISSQFPQLPNDDAVFFLKTYQYPTPTMGINQASARPAACPYILHNDGSPAVVPLYPPSSWVATVVGDVSPIQANVNSRAAISYCGMDLTSTGQFTQEQYIGGGGNDTVIMAIALTLKDGLVPPGMLVILETFGGYKSGPSPIYTMMSDTVIFVPSDPLGTEVTILTNGAQFIRVKFINFTGTEPTVVAITAWLGVPAN